MLLQFVFILKIKLAFTFLFSEISILTEPALLLKIITLLIRNIIALFFCLVLNVML